jgi:LuxR family maltose regulon positive regulatory protein
MTSPTILTTKLYVPPVLPTVLTRPKLLERLDRGREVPLTLVSGPPGYGKTTLLSLWAADHPGSVAWLTLDEGDNDPARFFQHLLASIQTVEPQIGSGITLRLERGKPIPLESILAPVLNEIAPCELDLSLVLDDYHVIEAAPIHAALTYLLEHAPPNLHLVISTRADPPLPFARLRGRGQLAELRAAELAFTPQEASDFLQNVVGLELSPADIATLTRRTEGWPAGLRMAAISLMDHSDPASFVRMFGADDRHVVDYLVDEVLARQPVEVHRFLLDTSILERLCGPLCEALMDEPDKVTGQVMLERLEAANLFLLPLDDKRFWYRYHRLMADVLRERLRQSEPDRIPLLHQRASAWYARHTETSKASVLLSEAIDHALRGADPAHAAELIEAGAEATLMRSELTTFLGWTESLPEKALVNHPRLCALQAMVQLITGRPLDEVTRSLERATKADSGGDHAGEIATVHAMLATFDGDGQATATLAEQALELLPEKSLFLRTLIIDSLGIAYLMLGDFPAAIQALKQAARMGEQTGNVLAAAGAWGNVAGLHLTAGRLQRAHELFERALELATSPTGQRLPAAGKALLGLGQVWREWNDIDAAERYTREGVACFEHYGDVGNVVGLVSLARFRIEAGEFDVARGQIAKAERIALESDATDLDDRLVHALKAFLALAESDYQAAEQWVEDLRKSTTDKPFYHLQELEQTTLARVLLGLNQPQEALEILLSVGQNTKKLGMNKRLVEILVLQARAYDVLGEEAQALEAIETALRIGEAGGMVRTFITEGEGVGRLLHEAARRGTTPEYVGRLLAAFPQVQPERAKQDDLVEPLSERELEVLAQLAEGYTNTEIGVRLHLALSTVKWHNSNIYGKLGVKNRAQAIARARSLGLLPED